MPSCVFLCALPMLSVKIFIKTKVSQYFLSASWQVMLCCVYDNLFELSFNQQLEGNFLHFIEISNIEMKAFLLFHFSLCSSCTPRYC